MTIKSVIKFICLSVLAVFCAISSASAAPAIADSACDSTYYESLKARAWLEAQREITQNQNLITKPDSVLSYSCFDQFAFELASATRNMFSETDRWDSASGSSLGNQLEPLVGTTLGIYLINNFGHSYRGGRASGGPNPNGSVSASTGNSYNCDVMDAVWMAAKCSSFFERGADGFFTLAEYSDGEDKRELPQICSAVSAWASKYVAAGLDDETGAPWAEDEIQSHTQLTDPAQCGATSPVATGLTVRLENVPSTGWPREFEEKICLQPGCYYNPSNDSCVSSF